MYDIKIKNITDENFKQFGSFSSILDPKGNCLFGSYYADNLIYATSSDQPIAFSPLIVHKDEFVVTETECHNYGFEGVLCLDDDVVLHVAPPSVDPCPEKTEAFLLPKGTIAVLKPGVWHRAAMPVNLETAHVLIILPMRCYKTDAEVIYYEEKDFIKMSF